MILEPGIAKDQFSEAGDGKECSFRVGLVIENYIYHFRDLICFVGGVVHVVHWYGTEDALGVDVFHMDKVFIYEVAHSFRVQEHLNRMYLTGVSSTDLNRKDDGCSMDIKGVGGELFG